MINQIKMSFQKVDNNPNMNDMPRGSSHWKCVLSYKRHSMSVYFSQGPALMTPPSVVDVLNCLITDANTYDCFDSFEEWAEELGYDSDSRKVEKIYHAVVKQTEKLKRFLGDDYDIILKELYND